MLEVERFAGEPAEWDDFGAAQRGWTAFHGYRWRAIMEKVMGHDCPWLAARDTAGRIVGILPLVQVRTFLFGRYLVSMPFLNYGGPLGSDAAVRALAEEAVRLAGETGVKLLELRSRVELPLELSVSHRKITVVLPLAGGDSEAVWTMGAACTLASAADSVPAGTRR